MHVFVLFADGIQCIGGSFVSKVRPTPRAVVCLKWGLEVASEQSTLSGLPLHLSNYSISPQYAMALFIEYIQIDGCFFAVMGIPMHRVALAIRELIESRAL